MISLKNNISILSLKKNIYSIKRSFYDFLLKFNDSLFGKNNIDI